MRPLIYVMVNGKLNLVADDQKKSLEYQFTSVDVPIEDEVGSSAEFSGALYRTSSLTACTRKTVRSPALSRKRQGPRRCGCKFPGGR